MTPTRIYPVRLFFLLGLIVSISSLDSLAAETNLYLFAHGFDLKFLHTSDSSATLSTEATNTVLLVNTGHKQSWPGITLLASAGHWDLSHYTDLRLQLKNTGTNLVTIYCRIDNAGADGTKHCVTESLLLHPGQANTLKVQLPHESGNTLDGKLFGMRGYPVGEVSSDDLMVSNITQLVLFVSNPTEDHHFEVMDIAAEGTHTPPTAWVTDVESYFPFIDTFGQYKHKDWPGKVHSLAELQQRRSIETVELEHTPGSANRDRYGGWIDGPKQAATGFFHTVKVDDKWWLVDPEGNLFWSHGIDCVRMLDATPTDERTNWFEYFPGVQAEYSEFLSDGFALKGHYAGRTVKSFSFAGANLKRKYGDDWRELYSTTVHQRLRSWGLNTIANWSDPHIYLMRRTPYTDTIGSRGSKLIAGSEGYWGQFPDVFDPSFGASLHLAMVSKTNSSANDPWCIGYFSDNEMSWGNETSLALAVLRSPAQQAAKRVFVNDLKVKYGDIAELNATWGTSHSSWDELLENRTPPDKSKAKTDLVAFYIKLAETYFKTVRDTIKATAPNQLYLGCRFAWVNDEVAKAAGKYCDVVSYNLYRRNIADFKYPGGDKPLLVGEFHFGALDRGLFHTGLVPTENQAARADAYRVFVEGALRHPQFVGTHWFQWQDEPTTGRVYDEENYQIGFLDIADTPYQEMISTSRDIGRHLYQTRRNPTRDAIEQHH